MSAAGERTHGALLAGTAVLAVLATGAARAADDLAGKVELATVDIEQLLDLPIQALSRRAESTSAAPGAVFVITGDDLRAQGARTLTEALRTIPGLFVYEDGHWPTLGFRGVGLLADYSTRVLFLVDGHPLGDSLGMGRSYIGRDLPIPLTAVRRVEVIKGPVGAVYGPTAFLGVVNVVTQGPGARESELAIRGQGAADGTNGAEAEALVARGGGWGGAVASASVFDSRGQDQRFPEWSLGGPPFAPGREPPPGDVVHRMDTSAAANGYLRVSALGVDGAGSCGSFTRRIPSAPYAVIVGDRRTQLSTTTCFAQLSIDRRPSRGWEVGASASYDAFELRDGYAYAEGVWRDRAYDRWASGELRARWSAASDGAHLGFGARGATHSTLLHTYLDGAPASAVGPIRKDFRTLDAWAIGDVAVLRALRLHGGTTLTLNELFGDRLTSKGAAVWHPTPANTVKLVYAEGFRAPTVAEAFYEDGTDFLANPGLRPERARSEEIVLEHRFGAVAGLSFSGFRNEYRDIIEFVTVHLPDGTDRQQAVNAALRTVRGVEAALTVRWNDRLQGWGGVSVQRTTPGDTPNAPRLIASGALWTRYPWRPLRLAVNGAGTSRRDKDPLAVVAGQRTVLPGYLVLGAAATLDLPSVRGLSIEASVSNLLDRRILQPVTHEFAPVSELPEEGRTFWVGLRWCP
jgi:iron complex outermembrane receptor protein